MKLRASVPLIFLALTSFGATPKEVKEAFLKRNSEYVASVFALSSPEREIETEKMIGMWHFGRLTAEGASKEEIESIKKHEQSMIQFWNEVKEEMNEGEYLYQITLTTPDGKIAGEGWIILSKETVVRQDLIEHQQTKLMRTRRSYQLLSRSALQSR